MNNINYMTIKYPKSNHCAICNHAGYTELHHILGRKPKWIVDESMNLIELCLMCHKYHTDPTVMRRIAMIKMSESEGWIDWCKKTAVIIGTKPNWIELCHTIGDTIIGTIEEEI